MTDAISLRIQKQFEDDARKLFASFNVAPAKVEDLGEGAVRFYFAVNSLELDAALRGIPESWWAAKGIIPDTGDRP